MNIYVGNLPYNITEDELKDVFAEYGAVDRVTLITDKYTGESKGFGFIEMPTQSEAEEAVKSLDGSSVKGRNIKVNQARPRTDRPQRRRSF
ncbi:MAG: RNA recognition motif domain-containing protein [Gammaproteobacteria bacterium]